MTAALRLVAADHGDIYVTEPASTPRVVWFDEAEAVDLFELIPRRNVRLDSAPKSCVRLRGYTMDLMDLEGM